jgi:hypothetical protein
MQRGQSMMDISEKGEGLHHRQHKQFLIIITWKYQEHKTDFENAIFCMLPHYNLSKIMSHNLDIYTMSVIIKRLEIWEGIYSSSIVACLFVPTKRCLPCRCLAMAAPSSSTILAFSHHVTVIPP